jgi:hypothetical protein
MGTSRLIDPLAEARPVELGAQMPMCGWSTCSCSPLAPTRSVVLIGPAGS